MKLYKKLKRMKKSTKIGLAGSLAYAGLSFITPVLANNDAKPFNILDVQTVEQAGQAYDDKFEKAVEDKKVTFGEISDLHSLLNRKLDILREQKDVLKWKVDELEDPYEFNSKIREFRNKIFVLNNTRVYVHPKVEKIKDKFDEKVLYYYPLLLEKPSFYSASDPIEKDLNPVMKEMVKTANEILKKYYQDNRLELLDKKESYGVNDLVVLHKAINEKRAEVIFNSEEIEQKKQKLEAKIVSLEKEREKIVEGKSPEINDLKQKMADIRGKYDEAEEEYRPFKKYMAKETDVRSFIYQYGDLNKYISLSWFSVYGDQGFLRNTNIKNDRRSFKSENGLAVSNLEDFFMAKGYDVEVASLKNPAHTMFPWPWWVNAVFGGVFPIFRNGITAAFVRRELDDFDAGEGLLETVLFTFLFDGIHPLVYPIRLLGMPFIMEPIRALTGARDIK